MALIGASTAAAQARPEPKRHAHWLTQSEGGRGAVRELAGLRAAATEVLQGLGGTVVRQTVTVSAFQRLESVNRQVWPDHVHIDAKFRLPVLLTVSWSAGL